MALREVTLPLGPAATGQIVPVPELPALLPWDLAAGRCPRVFLTVATPGGKNNDFAVDMQD